MAVGPPVSRPTLDADPPRHDRRHAFFVARTISQITEHSRQGAVSAPRRNNRNCKGKYK
jgi:hypothetical protein